MTFVEIVLLIQTLTTAVWTCNFYVGPYDSWSLAAVYAIHCYTPPWPSDAYYHAILLVFIVLIAVDVLVLICQMTYYAARREFMLRGVYVTVVLLEVIPLITIIPMGTITGQLFYEVWLGGGSRERLPQLVVEVVLYAFSLASVVIIRMSLSASAYLRSSPWMDFDPGWMTAYYVASGIISLVHESLVVFWDNQWVHIPLVVVHLAMAGWLLYGNLVGSTYLYSSATKVTVGFLFSAVICDILHLVIFVRGAFEPEVIPLVDNLYTTVLAPVIGLVVGLLVGHFVVGRRSCAMRAALAYDGVASVRDSEVKSLSLSDDERNERFRELGLDMNQRKARAFVIEGLREGSDLFLDFGLWKFLAASYSSASSSSMQQFLLQVIMYFPTEYRQASALSLRLRGLRDPGYTLRFLLGQVEQIRVVRQSSTNAAAAERLREMQDLRTRDLGRHCELWSGAEGFPPQFRRLGSDVASGRARCTEIVSAYPNSMAHAEALLDYLIECATDFSAAIVQRNRMSEMEGGKSFAIDHCFRAMVSMLPLYLKKGILTHAGEFIAPDAKAAAVGGGSSQSAKAASSFSGTLGSVTSMTGAGLDPAVEDAIGKSLFGSWKTQVSVQNCLADRTMDSAKCATVGQVLYLVVALGSALALYFALKGVFDPIDAAFDRQGWLGAAHADMATAGLEMLLRNAEFMGRLQTTWPFGADPDETSQFDPALARAHAIEAERALSRFFGGIAMMRDKGRAIPDDYAEVFQAIIPMVVCFEGEIVPGRRNSTLGGAFAYWTVSALQLTGQGVVDHAAEWWGPSVFGDSTIETIFCQMVHGLGAVSNSLGVLRGSSRNFAELQIGDHARVFDIIIWALPVGLAVLLHCLSMFVMIPLSRELRLFCGCLTELPEAAREAAARPIRAGMEGQEIPRGGAKHDSIDPVFVVLCLVWVLLSIGIGAVTFLTCLMARDTNTVMRAVNDRLRTVHVLEPVLLELAARTLMIQLLPGGPGLAPSDLVYFTGPNATNLTTVARELAQFDVLLDKARVLLHELSRDDGDAPLIGVDPEADDLLLKDQCMRNPASPTRHETYRCSGFIALTSLLIGYFEDIRLTPHDSGVVEDDTTANVLHAIGYHYMAAADALGARLGDGLSREWLRRYSGQLRLVLLGQVALLVFALGTSALIRLLCSATHEGIKMAVRRLAPEAILAHVPLLNYIIGSEGEGLAMSTTRQIINESADGILAVDTSLQIESVNRGAQKILGFSADQLLGQTLALIFVAEDADRIANQARLMIRKEAGRSYTTNMLCRTESLEEIPVITTMVGMGANISSFLITLKDQSKLRAQQAEAQQAKERSEQLLAEILPGDVVQRLNRGERDICFVVQCATLAFLDIEKFSSYAAHLEPQETMRNLALIFHGYDEKLRKYDLCTKVKLVGDVYMMAAGLFAPGVEPSMHAEQSVRFGCDALAVIEDANAALHSALALRVGINTGGPLTAGVLGADKPVFDILGDAINVAARLQSMAPAGTVQVSEAVRVLLTAPDLAVVPRGEIVLKGKGTQPAFLVHVHEPTVTQRWSGVSPSASGFLHSGKYIAPARGSHSDLAHLLAGE
jgi:PAS domain S-box-containing protein